MNRGGEAQKVDSMRASIWLGVAVVSIGALGGQAIVPGRANGTAKCVRRAYALMEGGSCDEAAAVLERGLQQNPADACLHAALAEALNGMGCSSQALDHYSIWARLEPHNPSALWALGTAYAGCHRYREAISTLQRYASLGGVDRAFYRLLSYCYRKAGQPAQARRARHKADLLETLTRRLQRQPPGTPGIWQYM